MIRAEKRATPAVAFTEDETLPWSVATLTGSPNQLSRFPAPPSIASTDTS